MFIVTLHSAYTVIICCCLLSNWCSWRYCVWWCDCDWHCLFAVLAELRRMQERISVIEAKLAQKSQNRKSRHSVSSVAQVSADCVTNQSSVSQTSHSDSTVAQKSLHLNQSLSKISSVAGNNSSSSTCSLSTTKSQVSTKPGDGLSIHAKWFVLSLGMLNDNRKIDYRNRFSFSFACLYYWFSKWVRMAPCGAGAPLSSLVHLLPHLFPLSTFLFLSLALPIFFFCPSFPFLPE